MPGVSKVGRLRNRVTFKTTTDGTTNTFLSKTDADQPLKNLRLSGQAQPGRVEKSALFLAAAS